MKLRQLLKDSLQFDYQTGCYPSNRLTLDLLFKSYVMPVCLHCGITPQPQYAHAAVRRIFCGASCQKNPVYVTCDSASLVVTKSSVQSFQATRSRKTWEYSEEIAILYVLAREISTVV